MKIDPDMPFKHLYPETPIVGFVFIAKDENGNVLVKQVTDWRLGWRPEEK